MPVYEYQCGKCEKQFEYQQRMADEPKTVCEACGGPLERLISRSAFAFKGGGWYKDLYASSKPKEAQTAGDSSAASESKPAAEPSKSSGEASTSSSTTSKPDGGSGSTASSSAS